MFSAGVEWVRVYWFIGLTLTLTLTQNKQKPPKVEFFGFMVFGYFFRINFALKP